MAEQVVAALPQLNSAWWLTAASATPPCSKPDRLRTAASTACGGNALNASRSPATCAVGQGGWQHHAAAACAPVWFVRSETCCTPHRQLRHVQQPAGSTARSALPVLTRPRWTWEPASTWGTRLVSSLAATPSTMIAPAGHTPGRTQGSAVGTCCRHSRPVGVGMCRHHHSAVCCPEWVEHLPCHPCPDLAAHL